MGCVDGGELGLLCLGAQSWQSNVARNSKFSREAGDLGSYMQSLGFKMFATKFNFVLLYSTAGQTKQDHGPNMTHRVCNLCLVSLESLRRELQLHGDSGYFCDLVIFV